jgi:hypothetical protein
MREEEESGRKTQTFRLLLLGFVLLFFLGVSPPYVDNDCQDHRAHNKNKSLKKEKEQSKQRKQAGTQSDREPKWIEKGRVEEESETNLHIE